MTRAAFGLVLGTIGSAIGFYVWAQRLASAQAPPRGMVIYRNTPAAG